MENDPFTVCNSPLPNVQQAINSFRIATIKRLENSILPVDSRSQYCDTNGLIKKKPTPPFPPLQSFPLTLHLYPDFKT